MLETYLEFAPNDWRLIRTRQALKVPVTRSRVIRMGFKVKYLENGRLTGNERIPSLESAKARATAYAARGPAFSAEVVEGDGTVIFRRPMAFDRPLSN